MKNGDPKGIALRKAKLDYIQTNRGNNRTHPLFWAAFVPVGNMEPITGGWPWWVFLTVGVLVLGVGWFWRKGYFPTT